MAQSRKSIKKGDKSPITSVGREGVNLAMPRPQQEHTSKREKQLLIVTHNNTIPTKTLCDRHLVNLVSMPCRMQTPLITEVCLQTKFVGPSFLKIVLKNADKK